MINNIIKTGDKKIKPKKENNISNILIIVGKSSVSLYIKGPYNR